jgi:hypothetical protein
MEDLAHDGDDNLLGFFFVFFVTTSNVLSNGLFIGWVMAGMKSSRKSDLVSRDTATVTCCLASNINPFPVSTGAFAS